MSSDSIPARRDASATRTSKRRATRTLTAVLCAAVVATIAACGAENEPQEPETTVTVAPGDAPSVEEGDGVRFDPVGQAADDGDFDPLVVPKGMPHGVGADVDDELLATGYPQMGDTFAVRLGREDWEEEEWGEVYPVVLLSFDDVSKPIPHNEVWKELVGSGANGGVTAGAAEAQDRVVQKVTFRIREVARTGDSDLQDWWAESGIRVQNLNGDVLSLIAYPDDSECRADLHPLADHDLTTNDTVEVCLYAYGGRGVADPTAWAAAVGVNSFDSNGQAAPFMMATPLREYESPHDIPYEDEYFSNADGDPHG